jgi:hypothetical protein
MEVGINNSAVRWFVCLLLTGTPSLICAQETTPLTTASDSLKTDTTRLFADTVSTVTDSYLIEIAADDSVQVSNSIAVIDSFFSEPKDSIPIALSFEIPSKKSDFKPNPKTAYLSAFVFPGFGQIYNRQYWKLPIVYGGLMGSAYAISWNNRTYQDYKNAYFSIMEDRKADPSATHPETWSENWLAFVPGGVDPATRLHSSSFHNDLKRGKDYYRRYRDLSIIISVGIYLITVADAYVDAQMFDFDVSSDLSFRVTPEFRPETITHSRTYGLSVCMTF